MSTLSINELPESISTDRHYMTLLMIHNLSKQLDIVAELNELKGGDTAAEFRQQVRRIASQLRQSGDMKALFGNLD